MKKLLAQILSAVLLVGVLAGCGGSGEKTASGDGLEGVWRAEMDRSDVVNQYLAGSGMGEFVNISEFSAACALEVKDDGTYAMTVDKDALAASLKDVAGQVKDGAIAYMEKMFRDQGLEFNVDEAMAGVDIDGMVNQIFSEEAVNSMADSVALAGRYKVEEGKLYLSDSLDKEPGGCVSFVLNGDALTLDKGDGEVPGGLDQFLPMEFTRG